MTTTTFDQSGAEIVARYSKGELAGAIGRINSPLVHLPLEHSLAGKFAGDLDFDRLSTATYVDRYGVLQTAAAGVPRFEEKGLLVEGSSTNNLVHSQDFNEGGWSKQYSSFTADATTAPDGTTTAGKLIPDTSNNTHRVGRTVTGVADNEAHTFSAFAKAAGYDFLRLVYVDKDGTWHNVYFDLADGVVATTSGAEVSAKITPLADDWYRCDLTVDDAGAGANSTAFAYVVEEDAVATYTGDGTSGIYLWGAQLEELPFASSYIPTSGSAVTRAADFCNLPFAQNMALDAWTVTLRHTNNGEPGYSRVLWQVENGGDAVEPRVHITHQDNGDIYVTIEDSSGTSAGGISYTLGNIAMFSLALSWDGLFITLYVDGVEVVSAEPSAHFDAAAQQINLGGRRTDLQNFGNAKDFRIYPFALTAAEINLLHGEAS